MYLPALCKMIPGPMLVFELGYIFGNAKDLLKLIIDDYAKGGGPGEV